MKPNNSMRGAGETEKEAIFLSDERHLIGLWRHKKEREKKRMEKKESLER